MISFFIAIASLALIVWIMHVYSDARSGRARVNEVSWLVSSHAAPPTGNEDAVSEENSFHESSRDFSEINRAYRIADMHFSRGDFEEAERWFIKVLALHEDHPEALNRLGVIYIQQGNARRAEILYQKLLSITQKEPVYYGNYGRCLYNQKRLRDAIEAYENAIKLDSSKPNRLISVGQIYYELKEYDRALAYFIRALEIDPQNRDYLAFTVELAELLGDADRAHQSLKKLVELDPYNEEARKKLERLKAQYPLSGGSHRGGTAAPPVIQKG